MITISTTITANTITFLRDTKNTGTLNGDVTFKDGAINEGQVNGSATFENGAINKGYVTGPAHFKTGATNASAGVVNGNAIFECKCVNDGTVNGNATFKCDSSNGAPDFKNYNPPILCEWKTKTVGVGQSQRQLICYPVRNNHRFSFIITGPWQDCPTGECYKNPQSYPGVNAKYVLDYARHPEYKQAEQS